MNNSPVLLLTFNRPDTTKKVFEAIGREKPSRLFVAADGPRKGKSGETEKCKEVRKITENVNWRCDVKRLYRDKNLGCRKAVSSAIDWFFENVSEGIVLEDDCLPDPTFFRFCNEMLVKFRNDKRVMHVSGDNFQKSENRIDNSYYFSIYPHIWGWATWKRAWNNYKVDMPDWPVVKKQGKINNKFRSLSDKIYWQTIFDAVYNKKIDTWDYQWLYTVWKDNGKCINPGKNLVENIGFGNDATHTAIRKIVTTREKLVFPLTDPSENKFRNDLDSFTSNNNFKHDPLTLIYLKLKYR